MPSCHIMRPELMYCVAFWLLDIRPEIGESTLRPLADLVPRHTRRSRDIERDLEIIRKIGTDSVRFWVVRTWSRLVRDGELIAFARTLIQPWRGKEEVGYTDRLPDCFFGIRIVDLGCKLNRGVPDSVENMLVDR